MQKAEKESDIESFRNELGLNKRSKSAFFKESDESGRIYPNYFAPVIVNNQGKNEIEIMRYRVRPKGSSEEIPSKFNVFNARLDSLENRKTWKTLFLKNHGIFPFIRFYEWVEQGSKKALINFKPQNRELMWAPILFDEWTSKSKKISFKSFALITTDPPQEIEEQGHDRCPIFLKKEKIDKWLNSKTLTHKMAYGLLNEKENVTYKFTNGQAAGITT